MSRAKSPQRRRQVPAVGASELAQMDVCERRVLFEHRYGPRFTRAQAAAIERGRLAHLHFFHECGRDSAPGATGAIAGQGAAAKAKATPLRRWLMRICLRLTAAVCTQLRGRSGAPRAVCLVLRPFIRFAARYRARREDGRGD